MSGWTQTGRSVVYPWHCDQLGHMNVQNYVGFFDVGAFHFLSQLGFRSIDMHDIGETLVDAQHTIKYLVEQPVGSLLLVESAITKVGTKSLIVLHRMSNTETGDVAATNEVVAVYFDLKTRKSKPIPDDLKARAMQFIVDPADLE
jgi:acyl-CoA thioester hydrolase